MGLFNTYKSSGEKTSSAAIKSGAGYLGGVIILTDGTNDATVILYDNTSASGTKLFEMKVAGGNNGKDIMFPLPITFTKGCYASISGTGASCIVYYQ